MKSKTGVLVSIKIVQLIGSIICLALHIYGYSTTTKVRHITIFCGTYMGFCLVNTAFLVSAIMGKPAAEELDMAFGVLGSCLFYSCGVMCMYYLRQQEHAENGKTTITSASHMYEIDPQYVDITRAVTVVSLMTALSFVFDACLKFDMWKYDLDVRKNRLSDDAFDRPDLRLFCFSLCHKWYQKWKQRRDRPRTEREEGPSAEALKSMGKPFSEVKDETPQRMRERTGIDTQHKWGMGSLANISELSQSSPDSSSIEIRLSLPLSSSEEDSDVIISSSPLDRRSTAREQVQYSSYEPPEMSYEEINLGGDSYVFDSERKASGSILKTSKSAESKLGEKTSSPKFHPEGVSQRSPTKQYPSPAAVSPPSMPGRSQIGDHVLATQSPGRGASRIAENSLRRSPQPSSTPRSDLPRDNLSDISINLNTSNDEAERGSTRSWKYED